MRHSRQFGTARTQSRTLSLNRTRGKLCCPLVGRVAPTSEGRDHIVGTFRPQIALVQTIDNNHNCHWRRGLFPVDFVQKGKRLSSLRVHQSRTGVRTISTEQVAWRATNSATLPSKKRSMPLRPCEPTTIRSALHSAAESMIPSL
jgi:hypothetical protein